MVEVMLLPATPGVSGTRVMTPPDTVHGAKNAVEALIALAKFKAVWLTLPLSLGLRV